MSRYQVISPGQPTLTARDKNTALRKAQAAANRTRRTWGVYVVGHFDRYLEVYVHPEGQR